MAVFVPPERQFGVVHEIELRQERREQERLEDGEGVAEKDGYSETEDIMDIAHVIWTLIVGLVVGAVARLLVPGQEHLSFFMTSLLGVMGSFVGGFLGSVISRPAEGSLFDPAGFVLSVVGAIIVLVVWHHFM